MHLISSAQPKQRNQFKDMLYETFKVDVFFCASKPSFFSSKETFVFIPFFSKTGFSGRCCRPDIDIRSHRETERMLYQKMDVRRILPVSQNIMSSQVWPRPLLNACQKWQLLSFCSLGSTDLHVVPDALITSPRCVLHVTTAGYSRTQDYFRE